MKRLFQIIALTLAPMMLTAQDSEFCTTEATAQDVAAIMQLQADMQRTDVAKFRTTDYQVPVQIHILRRNDQTGGVDLSSIMEEMATLNEQYAAANIEFFVNKNINFIDSDNWFDFNRADETEMAGANDVYGALNIYFANSIRTSSGTVCGYTHLPSAQIDRVFIAKGCSDNGSTLSHEIGHYLSLLHTHGQAGIAAELVDGSNAATAGDLIKDTPADPKLTGLVNNNCEYTGTGVDAHGHTYQPDVNNIMSYAPSRCRANFTQGQIDQMVYSLVQQRSSLQMSDEYISVADMQNQLVEDAAAPAIALQMWPNPTTNGQVSLSLNTNSDLDGYYYVTIMDISGRVVYSATSADSYNASQMQLNLNGWEKGIYMVSVVANNQVSTQKLIYQ